MPRPDEVIDAISVAKECLPLILYHRNSTKERHPDQVALTMDLINTAIDALLPIEPENGVDINDSIRATDSDNVKIFNLSTLSRDQIHELIKRKMEGN